MSKRSTRRKISAKSMKGTQLIFAGGETTITAEAEKTATFSMTLYSGGPIRPEGWSKPHPLVVDLDGMVVIRNGSIPFNRGHRGDEALVGQGTAKIAAGEIKITDGVFSFSNEHTTEIIESSKSGFVWASSMEAILLSTCLSNGLSESALPSRIHGRGYECRSRSHRSTRHSRSPST